MDENNKQSSKAKPISQNLYLIPEEFLLNIINGQDKIIKLLENKPGNAINGYISEKEAMKLLNKKVTWFWQMRSSGQLKFKRIGQTVYYSMNDITQLLKTDSL